MRARIWFAAAVVAATVSANVCQAQAPAGATGQCKDGTYTNAAKKAGACGGHKGVQTWFAESGAGAAGSAAPAAKASAAKPAAASAPAPSAKTAPAPKTAPAAPAAAPAANAPATTAAAAGGRKGPAAEAAAKQQAPGGGPGMVWVNTDTKVYHCPGGTFYGKTKAGKYMSEADAKAMGARPDRNKPCGK